MDEGDGTLVTLPTWQRDDLVESGAHPYPFEHSYLYTTSIQWCLWMILYFPALYRISLIFFTHIRPSTVPPAVSCQTITDRPSPNLPNIFNICTWCDAISSILTQDLAPGYSKNNKYDKPHRTVTSANVPIEKASPKSFHTMTSMTAYHPYRTFQPWDLPGSNPSPPTESYIHYSNVVTIPTCLPACQRLLRFCTGPGDPTPTNLTTPWPAQDRRIPNEQPRQGRASLGLWMDGLSIDRKSVPTAQSPERKSPSPKRSPG